MILFERQQTILRLLEQHHTATIKQLADAVYASESSVRRDIEALEKQGRVQKVYGGVILTKYKNSIVPLSLRDTENAAVKEKLAQKAAELIPNGAVIFLDASSTTQRILRYIHDRRNLKIITNSLRVFHEAEALHAKLYCTGGTFNKSNHAFSGPAAERFLRAVSADIVFFSSQGLSLEGEISDASEEETSLRRIMLARAEKKIFLCDSSKLGQKRLFTVCTKKDVDQILCDVPLPWDHI